jgi:hypothetical protein
MFSLADFRSSTALSAHGRSDFHRPNDGARERWHRPKPSFVAACRRADAPQLARTSAAERGAAGQVPRTSSLRMLVASSLFAPETSLRDLCREGHGLRPVSHRSSSRPQGQVPRASQS